MTYEQIPTVEQFVQATSDSSKRFYLEAFCFSFDFGLNIHFDDMDDLKQITKDVEFEFWMLGDSLSDLETDVNNFDALKKLVASLEALDPDDYDKVVAYAELVEKCVCATLEDAKTFYEDNFRCEYVSDDDFGRYLVDEIGALTVPEELEMYFDYERYGHDMLIEGYFKIGKRVYINA